MRSKEEILLPNITNNCYYGRLKEVVALGGLTFIVWSLTQVVAFRSLLCKGSSPSLLN